MTLSLKRRLLSKPGRGSRVQVYDLSIIRARNKNKAHSYLLDLFRESSLSKGEIAKMLGKKPEQITRWLAGPGNMTLDTLSDLIFVMKGKTFEVQAKDDFDRGKSNKQNPEWLQKIEPSEWKKVQVAVNEQKAITKNNHYVAKISSHKERTYEQFRTEPAKEIFEIVGI